MKRVRRPEPHLDVEAIKARLAGTTRQCRCACGSEALADARVDIVGLLAELERLTWMEREHRYEFADLLAAAREGLDAANAGEGHALYGLRMEVNRHRQITAEELDAWRNWSDVLPAR